jgi:hypothetical protein
MLLTAGAWHQEELNHHLEIDEGSDGDEIPTATLYLSATLAGCQIPSA